MALLTLLLALCLVLPGPTPAAAEVNDVFYVGVGVVGLLAAGAVGYGLYETKMRPGQFRLLDGEFYGCLYLGASFATSQDLKYNGGAFLNNGLTTTNVGKFRVANNIFDTRVVGG